MKDLGLLVLRLTLGALLSAHGAQKLFGWFGGHGLKGTHSMMEKLGMRPGQVWGTMAALGEFSGGMLTALGLLNPLGPLNIMAAMAVAVRRVHWKLPVFASQGGAELPLTNFAAALAIAVAGPGRYSLDRMLGIRLPRWLSFLATVTTVTVTYAALQRPEWAETVIEKATGAVTGQMRRTEESGLEVETRPQQQETPAQQPAL